MANTANRIIKNTSYLYIKMGITMFISLYTTRLILNSLGASDFGIFNIVGGAIAMLGFLSATMASATQRFMSYTEGQGDNEKKKSIFNISLIIHFFTALFIGLLLIVAGYFFFNGILNISPNRIFAAKVVYGSLILSTIFTIMSVPYDAVLNSHENMLYYSIIGIIESFLKLAVASVCAYANSDRLILYGILMACIPFIILTIMRIYCHKKYSECTIRPHKYWNLTLFKEMISFAGWNSFNTAASMISAYGQGILLNNFFGTILNASQGIAGQLNGQMQAFANNMLKAINPIFGKSAGANNKKLLERSAIIGAKYSCAMYSILAIPMFIAAPYILFLWLRNIPEYGLIFVRCQILKSWIEMSFSTLPSCITANGKIKKYVVFSSLTNILQLPVLFLLFYWGLPPYSIYFVSILFGNILVYVVALYITHKLSIINPTTFLKEATLPSLIISFIVFICMYYFYKILSPNSLLTLLLFIICSFIFYICIFIGISMKKEEKIYFKSALTKFIHKQ